MTTSKTDNGFDITAHRKFILQLEKKEKRTPARGVKIAPIFFQLDKNITCSFIYRPTNLTKNTTYPTLLHIRGTGYNTSAPHYTRIICTQLAEKTHCQVIDINHRLAPEFKCLIGFNDCYTKIRYICDHAATFNIDLNKLAILGYSSGGNFAALSAIQAKKDNLPLSFQILVSPVVDLSRSLKSHLAFENQDKFSSSLAQWFIALYLSNSCDAKSPAISPGWSNDLKCSPPTYILVGEKDRFRSDSEYYTKKLEENNVWTQLSRFKNANHVFFWRDIQVIEKIGAQVRTAFNLFTIPKPIENKQQEKPVPKIKHKQSPIVRSIGSK